jgi:serine/threonine protein kinase
MEYNIQHTVRLSCKEYPNPQWRSPEEARDEQNLTETVDIFSMGHILFPLICGHEPWNKLEPGGKPAKDEIDQKVRKGKLPFIPDFVMNSAGRQGSHCHSRSYAPMLRCRSFATSERP